MATKLSHFQLSDDPDGCADGPIIEIKIGKVTPPEEPQKD